MSVFDDQIKELIENPEKLIRKKPFTRGVKQAPHPLNPQDSSVRTGEMLTADLPAFERRIISQDDFVAELDPSSHKVMTDENLPSITVKTKNNGYLEIEQKRMPVPFQRMIRNKHVLHLCGYGIQFTLVNPSPSETQREDFAMFKQCWMERNQDGMRTKMVSAQKSYGDAGLLYYMDRENRIKSRLISYEDGYVICSHNDMNGDRLIESVYYRVGDEEYIDSYTDKLQYRHIKKDGEWKLDPNVNGIPHGFEEIPLVTKRGNVAWNDVQDTIEVYEIIYNIFLVVQKRHGWGVLYIKGQFNENARKIAGAVVLNDASLNKDGSAQYLTPPNPEGMLETLKLMEETIQKGSGTTFILPKDITTAGDISGVAIQITQSLDNEEALSGVIEWQNVASKMARLFLYGLGKELVDTGKDKTALTRLQTLDIHAAFKVWRPRNDTEYNQMLGTLKANGLISQKTGIEKNTESTPDEGLRVDAEARKAAQEALAQAEAQAKIKAVAAKPEGGV